MPILEAEVPETCENRYSEKNKTNEKSMSAFTID
jgi:hypothetical protein